MNFQTLFLICSIAFRQHRSMCVCAWQFGGCGMASCQHGVCSPKCHGSFRALWQQGPRAAVASNPVPYRSSLSHNTVIKGAVRRITPSVTVFNMCLTEASRNGDALQCEQWFRRTWAVFLLDPMQARRFSMHRHLQDGLEWIRARCD